MSYDSLEVAYRLKRIDISTISGLDIRRREHEMIGNAVAFESNEKIEILYMRDKCFEQYYTLDKNLFVGVTNRRIFQIDNGKVSFTLLKDIDYCEHEKHNIFLNDYVVCHLKNGSVIKYNTQYSHGTGCFVELINHIIERLKVIPMQIISSK